MTDTLTQLADLQRRADTLQAAHDALASGTATLSDNTVRDLLHYAETNARSYAVDQTIFHHVTSAHHESRRLKDLQSKLWNRQNDLQKQVDMIRKYHGFATAEALEEAVEAGQRAPVPVIPVTPAHHVTVSEHDKIIELAKERAKEAQVKAEAAQKK